MPTGLRLLLAALPCARTPGNAGMAPELGAPLHRIPLLPRRRRGARHHQLWGASAL